MRKNMKKAASLVLTTVMALGSLAGCGSSNSTTPTSASNNSSTSGTQAQTSAGNTESSGGTAATNISFLNSKGEIQAQLEDIAAAYQSQTGVQVDILACGAGEVPYTKITSMYNSGTAPTLAMLDPTDIVALAEEYALDLSDQPWVSEGEANVTTINGIVYGFPFCIEGRGIIYNRAAIEETLGREFDADAINSLDSLKAILEELRAAGMENPVIISKEDWSLAAHQLGMIYDTYDGTTAGSEEIIGKLTDGSQKAMDYTRFNQFVDTMDLLLQYNINGKDPLGALYEQDPIFLADKDAAFWLNGNWAWTNLYDSGANPEDGYGFIPWILGNDSSDFANTGIQAGASKVVIIDSQQASPEEQEAAKAFLNWLVNDPEAQRMLVEEAGIISPFQNNPVEPVNPLSKDIKAKMEAGRTFSSWFIAPGDHWSAMGAQMQKYIAGQQTREELATALDAYWQQQK